MHRARPANGPCGLGPPRAGYCPGWTERPTSSETRVGKVGELETLFIYMVMMMVVVVMMVVMMLVVMMMITAAIAT